MKLFNKLYDGIKYLIKGRVNLAGTVVQNTAETLKRGGVTLDEHFRMSDEERFVLDKRHVRKYLGTREFELLGEKSREEIYEFVKFAYDNRMSDQKFISDFEERYRRSNNSEMKYEDSLLNYCKADILKSVIVPVAGEERRLNFELVNEIVDSFSRYVPHEERALEFSFA